MTGLSERTRAKIHGQLAEKFPKLAASAKSSFAAAHQTTDHFGGSIPRSVAIDGATWQSGVTVGNEHLKIMLNGSPVPLAFAAREGRHGRDGWVMVYVDAGGALPRVKSQPATLRGDVRIVPGDRPFYHGSSAH